MMTVAFDTHSAVKRLRAAGVNDEQAETQVDIISKAIGDPVTKADLEPLATKELVRAEIAGVDGRVAGLHAETQSQIAGVRAGVASLEARLFRHLWVMSAGIVGATFTLLKLFP